MTHERTEQKTVREKREGWGCCCNIASGALSCVYGEAVPTQNKRGFLGEGQSGRGHPKDFFRW